MNCLPVGDMQYQTYCKNVKCLVTINIFSVAFWWLPIPDVHLSSVRCGVWYAKSRPYITPAVFCLHLVGSIGHDSQRETEGLVFSVVSCDRHHLCRVVALGSNRTNCSRDQRGKSGMAILDKTGGRSNWIHGWTCLYVCTMQGLRATMESPQSIQSCYPGKECYPGEGDGSRVYIENMRLMWCARSHWLWPTLFMCSWPPISVQVKLGINVNQEFVMRPRYQPFLCHPGNCMSVANGKQMLGFPVLPSCTVVTWQRCKVCVNMAIDALLPTVIWCWPHMYCIPQLTAFMIVTSICNVRNYTACML